MYTVTGRTIHDDSVWDDPIKTAYCIGYSDTLYIGPWNDDKTFTKRYGLYAFADEQLATLWVEFLAEKGLDLQVIQMEYDDLEDLAFEISQENPMVEGLVLHLANSMEPLFIGSKL